MIIYLMQHGKALSSDQDPAKPLSPEGRREVEAAARAAAAAGLTVDRILHSDKDRARQTAEILAGALGGSLEETAELQATAPTDAVAMRLCKLTGEGLSSVALVGHLPNLDRLASRMLSGKEEPSLIAFRNGALVRLEPFEEGRYRLAWTLHPSLLQA